MSVRLPLLHQRSSASPLVRATCAPGPSHPGSLLYTSWVTATAHERAFYEGGSPMLQCQGALAAGVGAPACLPERPLPLARSTLAFQPLPHPCAAGLAAVLPCFVVYLEVGKALKRLGELGLPFGCACLLGW